VNAVKRKITFFLGVELWSFAPQSMVLLNQLFMFRVQKDISMWRGENITGIFVLSFFLVSQHKQDP
jgi:hypothetical protein